MNDFKYETKYNIFTNQNGSIEIYKKSSKSKFYIMEQELEWLLINIQTDDIIRGLRKKQKGFGSIINNKK